MQLVDKIAVIFADERRQYRDKNFMKPTAPTLGSLNVGWGNPFGLLREQSVPGYVTSDNADRLLRLHATLDDDGRKKLTAYLHAQLLMLGGADSAHLAYLVLHRLGRSLEALADIMKANKANRHFNGLSSVMVVFSALLATEHSTMSAAWCQDAQRIIRDELPRFTSVRDRLDQILLRFVDAELADANVEIFADRDKVVSIWTKHFGGGNVVNLIEEIDQYFRDGERSETAFATCIDRLRVLLVSVCRALVDKAAASGARALPRDADEKTLLQHVLSIGIVRKPEFNLLRSLRDLASTGGAHALDAKIEEARLVKNMTYEVILLLLSRTPGLKA